MWWVALAAADTVSVCDSVCPFTSLVTAIAHLDPQDTSNTVNIDGALTSDEVVVVPQDTTLHGNSNVLTVGTHFEISFEDGSQLLDIEIAVADSRPEAFFSVGGADTHVTFVDVTLSGAFNHATPAIALVAHGASLSITNLSLDANIQVQHDLFWAITGASLQVNNTVLDGIDTGDGSVVRVFEADSSWNNVTVTHLTAGGDGGFARVEDGTFTGDGLHLGTPAEDFGFSDGVGGVFFAALGSNVTVTNTEIRGVDGHESAVLDSDTSTIEFGNVDLADATSSGSMMFVRHGTFTWAHGSASDVQAEFASVLQTEFADATLTSVDIDSMLHGTAAVESSDGTLSITDSQFGANIVHVDFHTDAGHVLTDDSDVSIVGTTFSAGDCNEEGSVNRAHSVALHGGVHTITDSVFQETNSATQCGAVLRQQGGARTTFSNVSFLANVLPVSSAIRGIGGTQILQGALPNLFADNVSSGDNACIHNAGVLGSDADPFSGTFIGNTGGVLRNTNNAFLGDSIFTGNTSPRTGGALRNRDTGTLVVRNSTFTDNESAEDGGAVGVVFPNPGWQVVIEDCEFSGNRSTTGAGGALSAPSDGTLEVYRSTFRENGAVTDGGAIHAGIDTEILVTESLFCGNAGNHTVHADSPISATFTHDIWLQDNPIYLGNVTSNAAIQNNNFFGSSDPAVEATAHGGDPVQMRVGRSLFEGHDAGAAVVVLTGNGNDTLGFVDSMASPEIVHPSYGSNLLHLDPQLSNAVEACTDVTFRDGMADADSEAWSQHPLFFGASLEPWSQDSDDDGVYLPWDCDDNDPHNAPGFTELCGDHRDNDCDEDIDEGCALFYPDFDQDGFGDQDHPGTPTQASGYVQNHADCDDDDGDVYPGASEVCGDHHDQDCDGNDLESVLYYEDADGDGHSGSPVQVCGQPGPHLDQVGEDCRDDDASIHPGAIELCDNVDQDCDHQIDEHLPTQLYFVDADRDGFGTPHTQVESCAALTGLSIDGRDCDDENEDVHPHALEQCDNIDHDCDGETDDAGDNPYYPDLDGDGFGHGAVTIACLAPAQHAPNNLDCDDTDDRIHPDADEVCDTIDNDCDGHTDDEDDLVVGAPVWFIDADEDGHGGPSVAACTMPAQVAPTDGDCDDEDDRIYPGAPEACVDHLDNDCDGLVDAHDPHFQSAPTYLLDDDGDGFGAGPHYTGCTGVPAHYVLSDHGLDCADDDPLIHPLASEVCDTIDNDCDHQIDAEDSSLEGGEMLFSDGDTDGYGEFPAGSSICHGETPPVGTSTQSGDCDDIDETINPGVHEDCSPTDRNCDEDPTLGAEETWYMDGDGDTYGDAVQLGCPGPHDDWVDRPGDCDDLDPAVHPNAPEICDAVDSDCDGNPWEGPDVTWWVDDDCDGFWSEVTLESCTPPETCHPRQDEPDDDEIDCDDADGQVEVCGADTGIETPDTDGSLQDSGCRCSAVESTFWRIQRR